MRRGEERRGEEREGMATGEGLFQDSLYSILLQTTLFIFHVS